MERLATSTEKALELAEQKANEAQCKLGETKLKLVKTASILSAPDKEFTDYKGGEKLGSKLTTIEDLGISKTQLVP